MDQGKDEFPSILQDDASLDHWSFPMLLNITTIALVKSDA